MKRRWVRPRFTWAGLLAPVRCPVCDNVAPLEWHHTDASEVNGSIFLVESSRAKVVCPGCNWQLGCDFTELSPQSHRGVHPTETSVPAGTVLAGTEVS